MSARLEPLGDHDVTSFRCGNDELDEWLHRHARIATGHGTRAYVLVATDGRAIGYFALAPHYLAREEAPAKLAQGAPQQIPAILLAKLALDTSVQGQGLGAALLVQALTTVLAAARRAGGRVVLIDAIDDDAWAFYRHHDFHPLPGHDRRLVMKSSTAAKALDLPWP